MAQPKKAVRPNGGVRRLRGMLPEGASRTLYEVMLDAWKIVDFFP